ncbi:MAG: c-type cytochrome [Myxococcota bacterium]
MKTVLMRGNRMKLRRLLVVCAGVAAMAGLGCDGDSGATTAVEPKPTKPVVEDPTKPTVEEPTKPVVEEPTKPVVEDPEETPGSQAELPYLEPEAVPIENVATADEPVFQQPGEVPEMLPYMHMPVPDPAVEGWQPAPLNPYPAMIDPALRTIGFRHVSAAKPRLMKKPVWQPWTRGGRIAVQGDRIFVADTDNGDVAVLNRKSGVIERSIAVGARPVQVVVAPSGRVMATVSGSGEVVEIDSDSGAIVARRIVGTEAFGLALTPDADSLLVTDRAGGRVVSLDAVGALGTPTLVAEGLDFPRGLAIAPNGRVTVVTRGASISQFKYVAGKTDATRGVSLRVSTPYEAEFLQGRSVLAAAGQAVAAAVQPESGAALVLHTQRLPGNEELVAKAVKDALEAFVPQAYYGPPPGWLPSHQHLARAIESGISAIDESGRVAEIEASAVRDRRTLEPVNLLMSVPQDIAHHPTLSLAFVASAGTDAVVMLNTALADPLAAPVGVIEVGMAPAGVAFSADGWFAYVLDAQSFAISEVDLRGLFTLGQPSANQGGVNVAYPVAEPTPFAGLESTDPVELSHSRWAAYGVDPMSEDARLGRRIFTDARNPRVTGRERFACASCHAEGDEDQTVWWFPSGPRQTPSLAGRLEDTGPYNWNGSRERLTANFERTIARMGGTGATQAELDSLERYLYEGVVPPANPHLQPGGLTAPQLRGKDLFEDATIGCSGCHLPGPLTDGLAYNLDTAKTFEIKAHQELAKVGLADPLTYNTPSLRGVWHTAPYLHDGSAATLRDVLTLTGGRMGKTLELTEAQRDDLISYLETL